MKNNRFFISNYESTKIRRKKMKKRRRIFDGENLLSLFLSPDVVVDNREMEKKIEKLRKAICTTTLILR